MLYLILYLILILSLLLFLMLMSIYTLSLIYSSIMGSPYVATRKKRIEEILKEVELKKGKLFIELGSGDGRIVRTAVRKYGVKGVGVDINPLLIFWAKILGANNIKFKTENIFDSDLKQADYVYLFLMPKLIEKLALKMNKELKKRTVVISQGWEKRLFKKLEKLPFSTYYYRIN